MVLLLLSIVVYSLLFGSFGFFLGNRRQKQEELMDNLVKEVSRRSGVSPKNIVIMGESEFLQKMQEDSHIIQEGKKKKNVAIEIKDGVILPDEAAFNRMGEKIIMAVLEAFSEKKMDLLAKLLTADLFKIFRQNLEGRESIFSRVTVVSFEGKEIYQKDLVSENKYVQLKVVMNQVKYEEDDQHQLITGSRDKLWKIKEIWTFVPSGLHDGYWLVKSLARC
jgi:predicted lipid-binding transport protein (Tim44 family)